MITQDDRFTLWLNPLPSETVLAALSGAILSVIVSRTGIFSVETAFQLVSGICFMFLFLLYAIIIHFLCASVLARYHKMIYKLSAMAILLVFSPLLLDSNVSRLSDGFRISTKVDFYSILMVFLLGFWGLALLVLTLLKLRFQARV